MYVVRALILFVLSAAIAHASATLDTTANGIYFLGTPERGAQKVQLEYGLLGDKPVVAVQVCPGCAPAVYHYLAEESQALDVPIFFNSAGLYLLGYSENTFVLVMADGQLGRKVWTALAYANVYAKDATTAKQLTPAKIQDYALALSARIMNQDAGVMAHGEGQYHLAAPVTHSGKNYLTYQIAFKKGGEQKLEVSACASCENRHYKLLPDESAILGTDVYRYGTSDYVFDFEDGVLVSVFSNGGGFGQVEWAGHNYNVWSNNQAYIRQLLNSQTQQDAIDVVMANYFTQVKQVRLNRQASADALKTEARELPAKGLQDAAISAQLLPAAKRWATQWQWVETLQAAYISGADWAITRNPLSGIVTGRNIAGVVTMKHPDGRCRYQLVGFRQQHDGQTFMNLHMSGVGPVYDVSCDKL